MCILCLFGRLGNLFNFLTGFIFYPVQMNPTPVLDLLFRYSNNRTGQTLNRLAFTPMFTAGLWGMSSPNRSTFDTPEDRQAMYDFCHNTEYGPCSLVTFTSVDSSEDNADWVVAQTYYQVQTGACSDSFSATREAWYVCPAHLPTCALRSDVTSHLAPMYRTG